MIGVVDTADVCDCCLLMIANADDSGCRDYFGHDHPTCDLPGAVPGDESNDETVWHEWTCAGCGTEILPGAYRHTVSILGTVAS